MPRGRRRLSASGLEGGASAPPPFRAGPEHGSAQAANDLDADIQAGGAAPGVAGPATAGQGTAEGPGVAPALPQSDVFGPTTRQPGPKPGNIQSIAQGIVDDPNVLLQAMYQAYPHPDLLYLIKRASR